MKTTAFLIFCSGVLITLDNGVLTLARNDRGGNLKAKGAKEVVSFPPPPLPSFPLLTLPSFSSFSLPALNFPYLQAFSQSNRMSSSERVQTTKTEYVEVTRRQTVHPVCYTAYEAKAPCLPYAQSDFHDDDYDNLELETVHQTYNGFNLNEFEKVIRATPALQIIPTKRPNGHESFRTGKYLELKLRRNGPGETSSKIEGSEFFPFLNRISLQRRVTEYHTKTVLITKLEKYTDRRVTATLVAVNCLPVDRSISMCQNYLSPIKESVDHRSDDGINFEASTHTPALTDSVNLKSEIMDDEYGSDYEGSKTEFAASHGILEPTEINSEKSDANED